MKAALDAAEKHNYDQMAINVNAACQAKTVKFACHTNQYTCENSPRLAVKRRKAAPLTFGQSTGIGIPRRYETGT